MIVQIIYHMSRGKIKTVGRESRERDNSNSPLKIKMIFEASYVNAIKYSHRRITVFLSYYLNTQLQSSSTLEEIHVHIITFYFFQNFILLTFSHFKVI